MTMPTPITEDDLHALVDGQLDPARLPDVGAYLRERPDEACRVAAWTIQNHQLQALCAPVMDEPVPQRLADAAIRPRRPVWVWQAAASLLIAVAGGLVGWGVHDRVGRGGAQSLAALPAETTPLVRHAAMAYVVYASDQRRPVEITAAHEDQLVAWLSKRMGAAMNPPNLRPLGYRLEGGRLLPGRIGPVAQFMYEDGSGMRLTLYVTREAGSEAPTHAVPAPDGASGGFRFAQDGSVNVFYWIDGSFGYAISSYAGRSELARVSAAVYKQLDPGAEAAGANALPGAAPR